MTITRRMTAFWASLALTAGMFLTNGSACARALAGVQGDVNGDGEFSLVDVVCLQRWLHGEDESLADWKAGDLNEDDLLDVFDLGLVKYTLIHGQMPEEFDLSVLPEYSGKAWIVVGDNTPDFSDLIAVYGNEVFEYYSDLDSLGRCGVTYASICEELMPADDRGEIGSVKPSGWTYDGKSNNNKYDFISGKYIYNRCHLIGFQLAGENANPQNLITGTRYLNIDGMLPFENQVADYVHEENTYGEDVHVLYRVTPVYERDNLVASGVRMEGWSLEDHGESICFDVYCYNVQPGVEIDYATGQNWSAEEIS